MHPFQFLQQRKSVRMYIPFFGGCIIVLLAVALLGSMLGRGSAAPLATRDAIAGAEREELSSAIAVFETIGYPNADLTGDIMPKIELHLHAAEILDALLASEYGEDARLLDSELYRYIQLCMTEINTAAAQGDSTELGVENLGVYMLILKNDLAVRFDENGALLPAGSAQ